MTHPPRVIAGGLGSHRGFGGGRPSKVLASAAAGLLCACIVVGLAILNSAPPAPVAPTFHPVTLVSAADIGAVNRNLTHIGARVRVVLLKRSCSLPARQRRYHVTKVWRHGIMAEEAPAGQTTVVAASQQGLTGVSFQVQGRAPRCLPVTGTLPYRP